eukprot:TRINITY_DN1653_c0_g1_i1.p1 TRINITY_DN1653_c0_g1~~TRINITY_DN1653_c0_g1_i1.p1  ORF type:complete len:316 (+),score=55.05 TRINITY_DN1653_c0_g1_i1:30-950(+)
MRVILLITLCLIPLLTVLSQSTGKTTRYWDCCKPSCAWESNVNNLLSGATPVKACLKDGSDAGRNAINICNGGGDGGPCYSCVDNQPFENNGVLYGFVAKDGNACCQCYELTFTNTAVAGKKMIVQVTNTGGDLGYSHFDIQMPGGGFGVFNGCSRTDSEPANGDPQFDVDYSVWGQRYGGVSSVSSCDSFPAELQAGCRWRFNSFLNADNPDVTFRRVKCPALLTDITGCILNDDNSYPDVTYSTVDESTTSTTQASSTSNDASSSSTSSSSSQSTSSTEGATETGNSSSTILVALLSIVCIALL